MAKVKTPVKGYSGTVAGVKFDDGVGHTDDERALAYFLRQGYKVSGQDTPNPSKVEENPSDGSGDGDEGQPSSPDPEDAPEDISEYNMDELKAYAAKAQIDITGHQSSKDALRTRILEVRSAQD